MKLWVISTLLIVLQVVISTDISSEPKSVLARFHKKAVPKRHLLYQTQFSRGARGWISSVWDPSGGRPGRWRAGRKELIYGATRDPSVSEIIAPFAPKRSFSILVELRVSGKSFGPHPSFGIIARASRLRPVLPGAAIAAGIRKNESQAGIAYFGATGLDKVLSVKKYRVGQTWHTYELRISGKRYRFLIDNRLVSVAQSGAYLQAHRIGLFTADTSIAARDFRVMAP